MVGHIWKLENGLFVYLTMQQGTIVIGYILNKEGQFIAPYWCSMAGNCVEVRDMSLVERKREGENSGWPILNATSVPRP